MSHYILPERPFIRAVEDLLADGFEITWTEVSIALLPPLGGKRTTAPGPRSGRRVKYTCPLCNLKAWSRYGAALVCGRDRERMEAEFAD
jgi:hypothetical protein